MVAASLLSTLLLAMAIAAQPVEQRASHRSLVKLSFTKRVNYGCNLVGQDQLRANIIKGGKTRDLKNRDVVNSQADNRAVTYVSSVGVGSPATNYELIIDTGSSNTWIGANTPYTPTSTSSKTSDTVSENSIRVEYGSGSFSGNEYIDQVTIAPGLVVSQQSIGVATKSIGFKGVDGILGIGPVDLTVGTLSAPDSGRTVPTVTDNLFSDGTISAHELSVSFEPITDSSGTQMNGELTWGGVDSSKYTGEITFTPITGTSPARNYWGIDASVTYGTGDGATAILSTTAGIVDTGTSLLLIATDAFKKYQSATGGVPDSATSLLTISSNQFSNLKSLFFIINGVSFELTPNAQIWPRALNTAIGGTSGNIYLIVQDNGSNSGSGLDFIFGQTWLERFYSVYDTANQRVGLATTPYTTATSN